MVHSLKTQNFFGTFPTILTQQLTSEEANHRGTCWAPIQPYHDNIRIHLVLTPRVMPLPERKWRSLRGVASLEEPEPLSHGSVSVTSFTSRHILLTIDISVPTSM